MTYRPASRDVSTADAAVRLGIASVPDVLLALEQWWGAGREPGVSLLGELRRVAHLSEDAVARLESAVSGAGDASGAPGGPPLPTLDAARYRHFELIDDEGGQGAVYHVHDATLRRFVALKLCVVPGTARRTAASPLDQEVPPLDPDQEEEFAQRKARFLREARMAGGLQHPSIVPVYEVGLTPHGIPYYTMRFVEGHRTLGDALEESAQEPAALRLRFLEPFLRVCEAVTYAHARDVVHRDIKPSNVALGDYGEVFLLDWGMARRIAEGTDEDATAGEGIPLDRLEDGVRTQHGAMLGTPGYMSPEAAMGQIDAVGVRSDVYSLGALLFEILTGRLAFAARHPLTYAREVNSLAAPRADHLDPEVPETLGLLCARMMARDPSERPASVDEVVAGIRSWQTDREVEDLLREGDRAIGDAISLGGEVALRRLDTAATAIRRAQDLRPEHPLVADLGLRLHEAREAAVRRSVGIARRRLMLRAGAALLVLVTGVSVWVAREMSDRRREADQARGAENRARGDAEELVDFLLYDLRDRLTTLGKLEVLKPVALRALAYFESLPDAHATTSARQRKGQALALLGNVLSQQGETEAAERAFERHRELVEPLVAENPSHRGLRHDLAVSLEHLASVRKRDDVAASQSLYAAAIELARALHAEDPADTSVAILLAQILIDATHLRLLQRDLEGAIALALEADGVAAGLPALGAVDARGAVVPAHAKVQVGEVQILRGELRAAHKFLTDAVGAFAELTERSPEDVPLLIAAANAETLLGRAEFASGRYASSVEAFRRSAALFERASSRSPTDVRVLLLWSVALQASSASLLYEDRIDEAIQALAASADVMGRHAALVPGDLDGEIRRAGELHFAAGLSTATDSHAAARLCKDAVAVARRVLESAPGNQAARWQLSESLVLLGEIRLDEGDHLAAGPHFEEAARLLDGPAAPPAAASRGDVRAKAEAGIGRCHARSGRAREAIEALLRALRLFEALRDSGAPPETHGTMGELCLELADLRSSQGDRDGALEAARWAVRAYTAARDVDSEDQAQAIGLVLAQCAVGEQLAKAADPTPVGLAEAQARCDSAIAVLQQLVAAEDGGDPRTFTALLASAHATLARIFERSGSIEDILVHLDQAIGFAEEVAAEPDLLLEAGVDVKALGRAQRHWRRLAGFLAGTAVPADADQHLEVARLLVRREAHLRALEHFEKALLAGTLSDVALEGVAREAAIAAAAAAQGAQGADAAQLAARCGRWLKADLDRHRSSLARIEAVAPGGAEALAAREALARRIREIQGDPRFDAIRDSHAYREALAGV